MIMKNEDIIALYNIQLEIEAEEYHTQQQYELLNR